MAPPPLRLRTLVVAVAVLALLIDVALEGERSLRPARQYRYWAKMHRLTEKRLLGMLARTEGGIARCKDQDLTLGPRRV
jgi:hypothetical protein